MKRLFLVVIRRTATAARLTRGSLMKAVNQALMMKNDLFCGVRGQRKGAQSAEGRCHFESVEKEGKMDEKEEKEEKEKRKK